MEFLLGVVTSLVLVLTVIGYRKFKDEWEVLGKKPVEVDHFYPLTGTRGSERAMVVIERNNRTSDVRGKVETFDGTTRKLGEAHTQYYFELLVS